MAQSHVHRSLTPLLTNGAGPPPLPQGLYLVTPTVEECGAVAIGGFQDCHERHVVSLSGPSGGGRHLPRCGDPQAASQRGEPLRQERRPHVAPVRAASEADPLSPGDPSGGCSLGQRLHYSPVGAGGSSSGLRQSEVLSHRSCNAQC